MNTPASPEFWALLARLVDTSELVIDRPRATHHPRYPEVVYPLDYGYLQGTYAGDGDGIDVWLGSLPDRSISAIVCTVDTLKRDAEIKVLLGCTPAEIETVLTFHRWAGAPQCAGSSPAGSQAAILVMPPAAGGMPPAAGGMPPETGAAATTDPPMPHERRNT